MEPPTKPTHRFSIWNLADPGSASPKRAESAKAPTNSTNAQGSIPAVRPLHDRDRHSAAASTRATLQPFSAKCLLRNGAKVACETKHIEPGRIDLAYKDPDETGADLPIDTKVGLDLSFFGFVRGIVRKADKTGFSMAPDIIYHEMLVRKLAELHMPGLAAENEQSNIERLTARITLRNPACVYRLTDDDAALYHAKIALLSHRVATLRTAQIQRAGTRLLLGWPSPHAGTAVRSFESGFTVEFDEPLDDLHEDLTFA